MHNLCRGGGPTPSKAGGARQGSAQKSAAKATPGKAGVALYCLAAASGRRQLYAHVVVMSLRLMVAGAGSLITAVAGVSQSNVDNDLAPEIMSHHRPLLLRYPFAIMQQHVATSLHLIVQTCWTT